MLACKIVLNVDSTWLLRLTLFDKFILLVKPTNIVNIYLVSVPCGFVLLNAGINYFIGLYITAY